MSRPSDDHIAAYDEWLNQAPSNVAIIETIEVAHSSFATRYFANWGSAINATLNDVGGSPVVTFERSQFLLSPPEVSQSTATSAQLGVSSYDGALYDAMLALTMEERDTPVTVKVRQYLHNNLSQQLINPAPVWTVHSAGIGIDVVTLELRADPLRVRRTGRYYTALEFPILGILT